MELGRQMEINRDYSPLSFPHSHSADHNADLAAVTQPDRAQKGMTTVRSQNPAVVLRT